METAIVEPLPLSQLLEEALRRFRRHFRAIYFPVAVPIALASGALPLVQIIWFRLLGGMEKGDLSPAAVLSGFAASVVGFLLFTVVYGLGYAALFVGVTESVAGRAVSMGRAWRFVFRPRVLGTIALSWLAFMGGCLLCVLPGIYVGLLFVLVTSVMVDEDRFGTRALGRSAELMRYNPQRDFSADPRVKAFLIFLVGILISYALSLVVQLPTMVVQQVLMARSITAGERLDMAALMTRMAWMQIPSSMVGALVQTAVHIYVATGIALLFFDVRHRKEGGDLEAAIQRLAGTAPEGAPVP